MVSRRLFINSALALSASGAPALSSSNPAIYTTPFIYVDNFFKSDTQDATDAIAAALDASKAVGGALVFGAREYVISRTLELPSGAHLIGQGANTGPGEAGLPGTVIRRSSPSVLFQMQGRSFKTGGPMKHSLIMRDILFDGSDIPVDLMQFEAVSRIRVEGCFFRRSGGRHLLFWEVFDSRITDCDFEWGGMSGRAPMVELRSGQGMELTNHVHFVGCRFESYPGIAVLISGENTNKIFFDRCKFESLNSVQPALVMENANVVHFNGLQVTGRGVESMTLRSLLQASGCSFLSGDIILEHAAWDGKAAQLRSYLELTGVSAVDLTIRVIDGLRSLQPETYVSLDSTRSSGVVVNGILRRGNEIVRRQWNTHI